MTPTWESHLAMVASSPRVPWGRRTPYDRPLGRNQQHDASWMLAAEGEEHVTDDCTQGTPPYKTHTPRSDTQQLFWTSAWDLDVWGAAQTLGQASAAWGAVNEAGFRLSRVPLACQEH